MNKDISTCPRQQDGNLTDVQNYTFYGFGCQRIASLDTWLWVALLEKLSQHFLNLIFLSDNSIL